MSAAICQAPTERQINEDDSSLKIDEFVRLAQPHDGHPKFFAMIEAYLDESGIHREAAVCVIAGYFAKACEWRKFEKNWMMVLQKYLVPLEKFHAKELFKKTGFFHGWNPRIYQSFVADVLDAIYNPGYKLFAVSSGVIVADFYSFTVEERRYMTGATLFHRSGKLEGGCPSKPYFVPFQSCVSLIAGYTRKKQKAHFYFGLDRNFYSYASFLFRDMKMKASWKKKLGNATLAVAAETPQLQAADVLAYLTYKHMKTYFGSGVQVIEPESKLGYLLQGAKKRQDFGCFSKDSLKTVLETGREKFTSRGLEAPL